MGRANKAVPDGLALFGGKPLFETPKPTSNLVQPDRERFHGYLCQSDRKPKNYLIERLEARLAMMHETTHCVTFNSGFWALALLIDAVRLKQKTEVILPSLTYRRMADLVAWTGLVPHFCDVDANTLANSALTVLPCINENTAAIIGVHPVGGHCDIRGLSALAKETNLPLIFDSVESVCERHEGRRIGSFGNAELFSLGASKLINGFEGGYVTTEDAVLAGRLREKRQGKGPGLSLSCELPTVHAAMALAGLDDLPDQIKRNRKRFNAYDSELSNIQGLRLIEQDPSTDPCHKNIVIEVLDSWPFTRDTTIELLNAENILARAYYAPPLTHKNMSYSYVVADLPNTDIVANRYISLPCGHLVTLQDIELIGDFLRLIYENSKSIDHMRLTSDR